MAIFFMSAKMVIFSTVQQKKKSWYFVGCSQKVLLGSTKKGNFLERKELTFLFSFFPAKNLGYTSKSLQFCFSCLSIFFLSQLLKLLWLILIKQVVFEFYMLQHEIVQFYAALQQQQAMERDTAHNKKISTLIVIYNRALQAKRLH